MYCCDLAAERVRTTTYVSSTSLNVLIMPIVINMFCYRYIDKDITPSLKKPLSESTPPRSWDITPGLRLFPRISWLGGVRGSLGVQTKSGSAEPKALLAPFAPPRPTKSCWGWVQEGVVPSRPGGPRTIFEMANARRWVFARSGHGSRTQVVDTLVSLWKFSIFKYFLGFFQ